MQKKNQKRSEKGKFDKKKIPKNNIKSGNNFV